MKPFRHAKGSMARWGGLVDDYIAIHEFIDSTKIAMPDLRHRAVLHNAFGCFLVEKIFGRTLVNSDGREVSTRDIAEEHIEEDMGFIPSLEDWLDTMPIQAWHGGIHRLSKDKRPPLPAEERAATRARLLAALNDRTESDTGQTHVDDESLDHFIRAVHGTQPEED